MQSHIQYAVTVFQALEGALGEAYISVSMSNVTGANVLILNAHRRSVPHAE